MIKLGICITVLVGMVATAHAQAPQEQQEVEIEDAPEPAPPALSPYGLCMAARASLAAQASNATDIKERTRLYQSMPECHPGAGEVVAPTVQASAPSAPTLHASAPRIAQPSMADPPDVTDTPPSEAPEIKSPGAALALSLGMTATGFVLMTAGADNHTVVAAGAMMFLVGPTSGHIYAGDTWNAGLGLRVAGLTAGFLGLAMAFGNDSGAGAGLAVGGSLLYIGASAYEIGTAPRAAREYNRKAASYKLVPIASPNAGGVSLVGSF